MRYQVGPKIVEALAGLDLEVAPGQFLIVRGRSGSGKTSLLHAIGGLQRPDSGSVMIGDADILALGASQADVFRRRHIGIIFQFFNLIPSLTVEMNVALPLLLEGKRLSSLRNKVEELLEVLGVVDRRDHSPYQLSGGEMQRVAIARALIVQPKVILADEPTGNLDSQTGHEIFQLLREQSTLHGVTTIMVTHEVDVVTYADRVVEISDGRVVADSGELPAPSGIENDH